MLGSRGRNEFLKFEVALLALAVGNISGLQSFFKQLVALGSIEISETCANDARLFKVNSI